MHAPSFRVVLPLLVIVALGTPVGAQLPPPQPPLPPPPAPPAPPPPAPPLVQPEVLAKLDPLVSDQLNDPTGQSYVIVRAQDAASVGLAASQIEQLGGTLGRVLPILDAQCALLSNAAVTTLAANPIVQRIALDRLMIGFDARTNGTIGVDLVRQQFGYDGSGIGVAVIDSGVTPWHNDLAYPAFPDFQRVTQFVDFVAGQTAPYDDYGHGTHVAGIIAGNGADSGGTRAGVAPAAHLVVLKVLDGSGRGRISNVIAALDYAVAHKSELNIKVINMSVGAGVYESFNSDLLTLAAKRAVEQGIVVVAAAGNHGRNAQGAAQHGAISAPGNAPWVLTVGASSHNGTTSRADDTIAPFSSRGPTAVDHVAKPDLVAPGVGIYSLSSPNSSMYSSRAQYLLAGSMPQEYLPYLSLSGTSQAAPVVAGTVALMLQANPALTPNAVKAILQYTAEVYPGHSALAQGAGFLNAQGAVDLARAFSLAPIARGPTPPAWSRQPTWGNFRLQDGHLASTASAWSTDVKWGAATSAAGQLVTWGVACNGTDCQTNGSAWSTWGASCSNAQCNPIVWGSTLSVNVVWGTTCSGANCEAKVWATSDDDTVVWGNTDGDTVVWGNSDSDTVVWGNSYGDTVVWGNSDNQTVVWGSSGEDSTCQPVIWDN